MGLSLYLVIFSIEFEDSRVAFTTWWSLLLLGPYMSEMLLSHEELSHASSSNISSTQGAPRRKLKPCDHNLQNTVLSCIAIAKRDQTYENFLFSKKVYCLLGS